MSNINPLSEMVGVVISCNVCKKQEHSYGIDVYEFADWLESKGWRNDKYDVVRCPKCKGKRIPRV